MAEVASLAAQLRAQDISKLIKALQMQREWALAEGFPALAKQITGRIGQEKRRLEALLEQVPPVIAEVIRNG